MPFITCLLGEQEKENTFIKRCSVPPIVPGTLLGIVWRCECLYAHTSDGYVVTPSKPARVAKPRPPVWPRLSSGLWGGLAAGAKAVLSSQPALNLTTGDSLIFSAWAGKKQNPTRRKWGKWRVFSPLTFSYFCSSVLTQRWGWISGIYKLTRTQVASGCAPVMAVPWASREQSPGWALTRSTSAPALKWALLLGPPPWIHQVPPGKLILTEIVGRQLEGFESTKYKGLGTALGT